MKNLITALLIAITPLSAIAAEGKMSFEIPKGWKLDKEVVSNQGIDATLYPETFEWAKSPAIVYVRIAPKVQNSLQRTITEDQEGFKEINPEFIFSDEPGLYTYDDKLAFVKKVYDAKNSSSTIMAYVDGGDSVSIIALDSKDKKAETRYLPVYKKIVNSYMYAIAEKNAGKQADKASETKSQQVKKEEKPVVTETAKPSIGGHKHNFRPVLKKADRAELRDYPAPKETAVEAVKETKTNDEAGE